MSFEGSELEWPRWDACDGWDGMASGLGYGYGMGYGSGRRYGRGHRDGRTREERDLGGEGRGIEIFVWETCTEIQWGSKMFTTEHFRCSW